MSFAGLLVVALIVILGCVLTYVGSQRAFQRWSAERQQANEIRLQSLMKTIEGLETRLAELSKPAPAPVPSASAVPPVIVTPVAPEAATKKEEITQEILAVLAAAVTAFLGKKVKIRSAKMLHSPYEIVNPWSQQGRIIVQASHSLRSRN